MNLHTLSLVLLLIAVCSGLLVPQPMKPTRYPSKPTPSPRAYKILEGDMRVSKEFNPTKRKASSDEGKLWPTGVVPYTISTKFNSTLKGLFKDSMNVMEDATTVNGKKCIQFVPRTTQANYVQLDMQRDCWSDLGRKGTGQQIVSLGRQCYTPGTLMHELMHTLGFYHEQSRADRDYYVEIHEENIRGGAEENFKKFALGATIVHLDQPYDYDSIMHYQSTSFSKDHVLPTITAKQKLTNGVYLGQRDHLSQIDIKMIQKLYGCQSEVVKVSGCKDRLDNCHLYGEFACQELPEWAAESCARTCKICRSVCEDKIDDCDQYGADVCQNYVDWSTKNCAKFCGVGECAALPTTTEGQKCEDKISDCADYGSSVCITHKPWASDRCQKFCGLCSTEKQTVPTTALTSSSGVCRDTIDCSGYAASACTLFRTYMAAKCPRHCFLCPDQTTTRPTTTTTPTTTPTTTTTTTPKPTTTSTTKRPTTKVTAVHGSKQCANTIANCADYGKDMCEGSFKTWMDERCSLYCGSCQVEAEKCEDKVSDCTDYGSNVCTNFPQWSKENCPKFCSHCTVTECVDARSDCSDFYKDQCGGEFTGYMKQNCAKFCDYC